MTPRSRTAVACLGAFAVLAAAGCRLPRPDTVPTRMIEPTLDEPTVVADAPRAEAIRLLETQARGHLGRRLLHQLASGELTEDPVWRWSSPPDRYLDSALRRAIAANPNVSLVDSRSAPTLALTLLAFQLESGASHQLVGVVEVQVFRADGTIDTAVVRAGVPTSEALPGNLASAAGSLLQRLASDSLQRVSRR